MYTVTFFATKGGVGRTVSTMAIASGFLALGKRVAVIDCTDLSGCKLDGRRPSALQSWAQNMAACKFQAPELELIECWTGEQVEDSLAEAEVCGVDVVLIDTTSRLKAPQKAALGFADLIISPANGPLEARCIVKGISDHLEAPEHVMGLVTGCRLEAFEAYETRAAFDFHPVFQSELPWAEALSDQVINGHIEHFASELACKPDRPGYARFRRAQAAWVAVLQLTFEIQWALKGQRLEPCFGVQSPFHNERKAVA
jgi:hypothetical protein